MLIFTHARTYKRVHSHVKWMNEWVSECMCDRAYWHKLKPKNKKKSETTVAYFSINIFQLLKSFSSDNGLYICMCLFLLFVLVLVLVFLDFINLFTYALTHTEVPENRVIRLHNTQQINRRQYITEQTIWYDLVGSRLTVWILFFHF